MFVYVNTPSNALQGNIPSVMLGEDWLVLKGDKVYVFTLHSTQANRDTALPLFEKFVELGPVAISQPSIGKSLRLISLNTQHGEESRMNRNRKTLRVLAAIVVGLLAAIPAAQPRHAAAIDPGVVDRVYPAVVQLGPIAEITGADGQTEVRFLGWGSGTIVDSQGFILTNHHVTDVSDLQTQLKDRPDVKILEGKLAVFITTDTDSPPVPTYIADVVADDANVDLAVVKITEDLSGHTVDNASLGLPSVTLGDSSKLKLGQQLHIFGYPAIGGETITYTSGDISGFTYEAGIEGRAWIKTSASISGAGTAEAPQLTTRAT